MKNRIYKILVVFLLFSLQSFLYAEMKYLNKKGMTVETRYSVPNGYKRVSVEKGSFAEFLRNQKLNQCADAIMLLRAEYFYSKKEYNKINFHFTSGFEAKYSKWIEGYRINVQGKGSYIKKANPSNTYQDFKSYMNMVFAYCGTLSLEKEMKLQSLDKMKIGDAFIKGGSPGHVVLIVDMAENDKGEKIFMLAQSYMPAQQTQILINPSDRNLGVWYSLKGKDVLITPEWDFSLNQLRTF